MYPFGNELPHDGEFIVQDQGRISYDNVVMDASVDLRSGTVIKIVNGVGEPMATGDASNLVAGILRHFLPGQGAGAQQKVSVLTRLAEVTDEGGRMVYPSGGANPAAVAADVAACQAGLRAAFIINR